jgi:DNA polymerase-3 subunit epsilon
VEISRKIIVVDIETTGFLNQGGKIVEIGIVKLDLNTGDTKPLYNSLIKESGLDKSHTQGKMGWIFKNSDLRFEDLENAPTLENQQELIQTLFNLYQATAYNKAFDFGFLKDRGFLINELPCPMHLATPILKINSGFGKGNYKWPSVEEAWKYFFRDISYIEAHRALDDAEHEAKIIFELYKLGLFI